MSNSTIHIIDNKGVAVLFVFGKNTYHMWSQRTITIHRQATYQLAEKQGQLGWYTKDGWLSLRVLNMAIRNHLKNKK